MRREKLYKVLVDGKSCHGGDMTWSLPKNGKPGKWHYLNSGTLVPCWWGFHLTRDWKKWLKVGCEIYEAEADFAAEEWRQVHAAIDGIPF